MLGQNAKTATTKAAQVLTAYEHMDAQLRRDLSMSNDHSTIEGFVKELNVLRNLWFDIYSSQGPSGIEQHSTNTSNGRPPQNMPQGRQGLPSGRFNQSNPLLYRNNGYGPPHQQGGYGSYTGYQNYGFNRLPGQYGEYRQPNQPWQGQRPQQQQHGQGNRWTKANSSYRDQSRRIESYNRPLAITSGDAKNGQNQPTTNNQQNQGYRQQA